jgi:hypothetical protein
VTRRERRVFSTTRTPACGTTRHNSNDKQHPLALFHILSSFDYAFFYQLCETQQFDTYVDDER